MTPKEKAKELYEKMRREEYPWPAKWCALIAVDEIIKCCEEYDEVHETHTTQVDYWQQVKQEIYNL